MHRKHLSLIAAAICVTLLGVGSLGSSATNGLIVEADLTVRNVKVNSVTARQVDYCYWIVNNGTEPVQLDGVIVGAALSADDKHDKEDIAAGTTTLSGKLAPGDSVYCCCAGLARIDQQATPFLVITVDVKNRIKESDESNNGTSAKLADAVVKGEPQDKASDSQVVVAPPYPQPSLLVKARPAPTIIFEPPGPPTLVFLPQVARPPRVIDMQAGHAAKTPEVIVIGGHHHGVHLPPSVIAHQKPPCICIPVPKALLRGEK